jgi:hypothetical protein
MEFSYTIFFHSFSLSLSIFRSCASTNIIRLSHTIQYDSSWKEMFLIIGFFCVIFFLDLSFMSVSFLISVYPQVSQSFGIHFPIFKPFSIHFLYIDKLEIKVALGVSKKMRFFFFLLECGEKKGKKKT